VSGETWTAAITWRRNLGLAGKLAFMIAAALMPLVAVTGLLLYLSRRRLRRPSQPPLGRLVPGE
jgi:uncharacterized iron-regulated membrane protein